MRDPRIENIAGALSLAIADELLRAAESRAPEAGSAAAALTLLGHVPGLPIERLRRALGLSHPGAVRLVDRLQADGLVARQPSERDRRAVALVLTPEGEKACAAILAARQGTLARALAALSPEERAVFGRLAEKMLRAALQSEEHAYTVCRLCDPGACTDCPVDAELEARG
ncbi:MarR family winged helix-turn-helix transcriptional regulator [Arenibaculum pallidiluteum]|uniref:MarR family winged helix-turn-helix transcriptional regulator n=1 Tax=Arenibaculum pallidiluteum TaxID=2812559 RepID=UPI001A970A5B|nr:MarR family transcriptional regulator [Arenibaculum pallidiluteum]